MPSGNGFPAEKWINGKERIPDWSLAARHFMVTTGQGVTDHVFPRLLHYKQLNGAFKQGQLNSFRLKDEHK